MHRQDYLFRVNTAYLFKKKRVDRGLGLAEAEKVTGVPANAISRVESGAHLASFKTYTRLQRGYGFAFKKVFREYTTEPAKQAWRILNARAQKLGAETRWQNRRKNKPPLTKKKKKRRKELKDDLMWF